MTTTPEDAVNRSVNAPDPGATGVDDSESPTPAGSAAPSGESSFVDGAEIPDAGDDGIEEPVTQPPTD